MAAILHCIVTGIENSRIEDNIKTWRWMSNIHRNKEDTLLELKLESEVCSDCNGLMIIFEKSYTNGFFCNGCCGSYHHNCRQMCDANWNIICEECDNEDSDEETDEINECNDPEEEDCVCGDNIKPGLVDGVMKCENCDIDGVNYEYYG